MIKILYWSSSKIRVILVRFQRILNFSTDLEKHSNIKFREHPSSWNRVVSYGRADGRTDGKSYVIYIIVAVCNSAKTHQKTMNSLNFKMWESWPNLCLNEFV
jgi:hypothetical protein